MTRCLSPAGILLAIRRLAEAGIDAGPGDSNGRGRAACQAVLDLVADNPGDPTDDGHALIIAAEILLDAADDVTADLRNNEGEISSAVWWDDLHDLIDAGDSEE